MIRRFTNPSHSLTFDFEKLSAINLLHNTVGNVHHIGPFSYWMDQLLFEIISLTSVKTSDW